MASLRTKTGTRLTRRRVQDLVAEAERGYDLSRAQQERVRGGRPSLDEGVSPLISYRVGGGASTPEPRLRRRRPHGQSDRAPSARGVHQPIAGRMFVAAKRMSCVPVAPCLGSIA